MCQHSSNYGDDTDAPLQAASMIYDFNDSCQQAVFLSDALSVLDAYQNNKLPSLSKVVQGIAKIRRVGLQWVPAHCAI